MRQPLGDRQHGRADDIADLIRRTLARWPDHGTPAGAQCMAALATAEYVTGQPERALDLVASSLAGLRSPSPASVTLRLVEGEARRAAGDPAGALAAFREGARLADDMGMESMAMELDVAGAVVLADLGGVDEGVEALGELAERAAAAGSVITESWARVCRGWLLLRVDPAIVLAEIEAGLTGARRIDDPIAIAAGLRSLAYARLLVGDVPGAVAAATALLDDLLARGALSNARLLVDVTAVLAHRCDHPTWASLAPTVEALPITTLSAAQRDVVPLPDVVAPAIGRHEVMNTVRNVLDELAGSGVTPPFADVDETSPSGWIERRPDTCEIGFAGRVVSVRRSKGLDDVVRLIEAGGREVHCLDLACAAVEESSTGPVLDDPARRQYERRILELQEEIDEADANHDLARTYKSQVELDLLIDHLTAALGVGRRTRAAGGTAEAGPLGDNTPHPRRHPPAREDQPQRRATPPPRRQHRHLLQLPPRATDHMADSRRAGAGDELERS